MCRFTRTIHACGHETLYTDPASITLCTLARVFHLVQGRDRAHALCTPLGLNNDPNVKIVMANERDADYVCPNCFPAFKQQKQMPKFLAWPNSGRQQKQLDGFNTDLRMRINNAQMFDTNELAPMIASLDPDLPEYGWLRVMLLVDEAGNYPLGDLAVGRLKEAQRAINYVSPKFHSGLPYNVLNPQLESTREKVKAACELYDRWFALRRSLANRYGETPSTNAVQIQILSYGLAQPDLGYGKTNHLYDRRAALQRMRSSCHLYDDYFFRHSFYEETPNSNGISMLAMKCRLVVEGPQAVPQTGFEHLQSKH